MKSLRNNKGFTLIELMIVVVIIGILAAIAIPKFSSVSDKAKQAEADPILKQMCTLANTHYQREDAWPPAFGAADDAAIGWKLPGAQYFSFSFAGGTATATAGGGSKGAVSGLVNRTIDCETGVIS